MSLRGKQKRFLRSKAHHLQPIFQIGKGGINSAMIVQIEEALEKRELIKLSVLKNCLDDPRSIAEVLADRTHSSVVHVIGRKIVLYRPAKEEKNRKIILP